LPRKIPEDRASANKDSVKRIRRRYKTKMNVKSTILPGEKEHVKDMVIVLKLSRYSNNQIGSVVGVSRNQVKGILEETDVAERLQSLQENLPGAALELLQGYSIEAVQAIADVLRSSQDDGMILKAASEILDRTGVSKVSRSEASVHNVNESKTTIGADADMLEQLRSLPPEKQEEAAQMIEGLENFLKDEAKGQEE
jgi:hypothetical protein